MLRTSPALRGMSASQLAIGISLACAELISSKPLLLGLMLWAMDQLYASAGLPAKSTAGLVLVTGFAALLATAVSEAGF
ncbi:hypothetical protein D3C72_1795040 [compost metagenome]